MDMSRWFSSSHEMEYKMTIEKQIDTEMANMSDYLVCAMVTGCVRVESWHVVCHVQHIACMEYEHVAV